MPYGVLLLDRVEGIAIGDTLYAAMPSGMVEDRLVTLVEGNGVVLASEFSDSPVDGAVWATSSPTLQLQLFRIIDIRQDGPESYQFTGVKHEPGKYDLVELDVALQPRPITALIPDVILPPTSLTIGTFGRTTTFTSEIVVVAQWIASVGAEYYEIQWRRDDGEWMTVQKVYGTTVSYENAFPGVYEYRVQACNKNKRSIPAFSAKQTVGDTILPPGISTTLQLEVVSGVVTINCGLARKFKLNLTANATVVFTNVPTSDDIDIQITQMGTYTLTWPGSVVYGSGTPYVVTALAGAVDTVSLKTFNAGGTWVLTEMPSAGGTSAFVVSISPSSIDAPDTSGPIALSATTANGVGAISYLWERTDSEPTADHSFSALNIANPTVEHVIAGSAEESIYQVWKVTATDSSGTPQVARAYIDITFNNVGYIDNPLCIWEGSYLAGGKPALDAKVGDWIDAWDGNVTKPGVRKVQISAIRGGEGNLFQLRTHNGATVTQTDTTPMDVPDGRVVYTKQMVGEQMVVNSDGVQRWETVVAIKPLGRGRVLHITAEDSMFYAGDAPDVTCGTHNIRYKP